MKRFLLLALALITTYGAKAQTDDVYTFRDTSKQRSTVEMKETDSMKNDRNKGLIYFQVPKKLNIKDKVIVKNNSPYTILQMVMAADILGQGEYEVIGQASYLAPGVASEICSWSDNALKRLRGKNLLLKIKGAKVSPIIQGNKVDVFAMMGEVHVGNRKIDKDALKNIRPDDITYDFRVRYGEADHDLYLYVEGTDNFDF